MPLRGAVLLPSETITRRQPRPLLRTCEMVIFSLLSLAYAAVLYAVHQHTGVLPPASPSDAFKAQLTALRERRLVVKVDRVAPSRATAPTLADGYLRRRGADALVLGSDCLFARNCSL